MKKKDIMLLLISGFIVVVAWIGFSIYHNYATSTISTTVGTQLQPIPGNFDTPTINNIKQRKKVTIDFSSLQVEESTASSVLPTIPAATTPTTSPATESATPATGGATTQ
jgi:hypothetical protein